MVFLVPFYFLALTIYLEVKLELKKDSWGIKITNIEIVKTLFVGSFGISYLLWNP